MVNDFDEEARSSPREAERSHSYSAVSILPGIQSESIAKEMGKGLVSVGGVDISMKLIFFFATLHVTVDLPLSLFHT
jgi:hypothetical protein